MKHRIIFAKPNIHFLNKKGYHCFDMHVHSKHSDGSRKITSILKKAKKEGIGLAITDHNEILGVLKTINNRYKIPIIPGIEITTKEGPHILIYFYHVKDLVNYYKKTIQPNKSEHPCMAINLGIKEIIKKAKEYPCLISAAHPFSPTRMGLFTAIKRMYVNKKILNQIDAIETICGSHFKKMNNHSSQWSKYFNLPITAGSDAHIASAIGKVITYSTAKNIPEFLDSIKQKKNFVMGKEPKFQKRILQYSTTFYKHFKYFTPTIKLRYKNTKDTLIHHLARANIYRLNKK